MARGRSRLVGGHLRLPDVVVRCRAPGARLRTGLKKMQWVADYLDRYTRQGRLHWLVGTTGRTSPAIALHDRRGTDASAGGRTVLQLYSRGRGSVVLGWIAEAGRDFRGGRYRNLVDRGSHPDGLSAERVLVISRLVFTNSPEPDDGRSGADRMIEELGPQQDGSAGRETPDPRALKDAADQLRARPGSFRAGLDDVPRPSHLQTIRNIEDSVPAVDHRPIRAIPVPPSMLAVAR